MKIKTVLRKVKLLFLLIASCTVLQSQPEIEWTQTFGGSDSDLLEVVRPTSDGGYIMSGETQSNDGDVTNNNGERDYWIVKTNSLGIIEWEKTFGGTGSERQPYLEETSDEGFIVAGYSSSSDGDVSANNGDTDSWILKLDRDGNLEWEKNFGGSDFDATTSISQTFDGGFLAVGTSASTDGDVSNNYGSSDVWILKLDGSGTIMFEKNFGGSGNEQGRMGFEVTDGGFIVTGVTSSTDGDISNQQGGGDLWVFKTDSEGNLLWEKTYGGSELDYAYSIIQTDDQGYLVSGASMSSDGDITNNKGGWDYWTLKLNENGELEWERSFGGSDNDFATINCQTSDGGYIVGGTSWSSDGDVSENNGESDNWIVKIDSNGNIVWEKSFGGSSFEAAKSIFETADGGLIVGAESSSIDGDAGGNNGAGDFWIFKLSPLTSTNDIQVSTNFKISPNPNNGQFLIETTNETDRISIQITNSLGQLVYENEESDRMVDFSKFPKGIYWLTILENGVFGTRSFVIE